MKALVARSYGPLEELEFTDLPTPVPGPGQLLVRMEAASINAVDKVLVTGSMREAIPATHPFVPGVDISGTVEAVGEGSTRFVVGDPVIAWNSIPSGALAEYALISDAPSAARRPAALTPAQGAALPTGALTAAALLDITRVPLHGSVLIVGASGGVGSFTVQLAKRAGLTVLAGGRDSDSDFLHRLGADHTLDYRAGDLAQAAHRLVPGGVDAVIDLAHAGPALATTAAAAKPGGRLVSPLGGPAAFDREVSAAYGGTRAPEGRLEALAAQAARGTLRIEIDSDYSFGQARQALLDYAANHIRGKVTVTF
ncbi:NADPH:quinone reductase-like Zn-dependent oxidoreductase [Streptomyces sp. 3330]|uniref:NADP-dependent oxidoreductase n=1 Tax=Streptomyces sp. 3330 TaxID=2817755 RepID=UPI0028655F30|nr:NADP-dependent oxidoreductase [Streptomyces sp. 3330]MDR6974304.1 NADPH:quinone reductase-like Zn-dependent oxidoreductase [Streptomyces sp. 3330]